MANLEPKVEVLVIEEKGGVILDGPNLNLTSWDKTKDFVTSTFLSST